MARTPGTLRRTPLALVTSLFVTTALLGGVAANAAPTVRKFSVSMPSCVRPSTTTTLSATITNSSTTTAGQKIGSIFLDSPEANFGNITPASAFIITDPTTGAVRTDWTGKLESAYGSGSDRFDLDGLYLVANNSGATLAPGASIKVTFPVTVKSPTGLKPFYPFAWTGLTPNILVQPHLFGEDHVTASCVGPPEDRVRTAAEYNGCRLCDHASRHRSRSRRLQQPRDYGHDIDLPRAQRRDGGRDAFGRRCNQRRQRRRNLLGPVREQGRDGLQPHGHLLVGERHVEHVRCLSGCGQQDRVRSATDEYDRRHSNQPGGHRVGPGR